jgi:hypothetical protein
MPGRSRIGLVAILMADLRSALARGTLAETAAALRGGAPPGESAEPARTGLSR